MSLAQGNNTPTRPRIEPRSPDPESDALTTRPVRSPVKHLIITADNQLNAKPRLSKDVRMQHFGFHKEDAINVNKMYLFQIY